VRLVHHQRAPPRAPQDGRVHGGGVEVGEEDVEAGEEGVGGDGAARDGLGVGVLGAQVVPGGKRENIEGGGGAR
jgi:hypothetical protein